MLRRTLIGTAALGLIAAAPPPPSKPATPMSVLAAALPADWSRIDPQDLLVIDLANGGRVAIALASAFAPVHIANIRTLARAGWFDGLAIDRVQDGYVTQWGDMEGTKPLSAGVVKPTPAEYERSAAGLSLAMLPYRDTFAPKTGYVGPFPVGADGGQAWLAHCYAMVGVGRENNPDTGTGAELYAVIGHAPRQLDRNIALIGRVVDGMEQLTALPRGGADMGFYADPKQRTGIVRERIAADLPAAERPAYEYLRPDSASYRAWQHVRANRQDDFYLRPAGAADLCGVLPPVRAVPRY
ncbi:peptidylprolyl isomerase [Sphingomonas sp. MMS24-J13]|uniref:peptidylprolyl isomerase n=1 Tax=Sphingomonas sp. MMS24-J13 TaxID=3238686 RepID=UPI00384CCE65